MSAWTLPAYLRQFDEPAGYLDFARVGPVSADVRTVLTRSAELMHGQGLAALDELDRSVARTARTAAELLDCLPHEIAFVGSTSHGMFAAAHAVRGEGVVLVGRDDFPGAVYPWLRAADHGRLAVRLIDGPVTADSVRAHLDDRVRAVSVCAVDSATGFRAPLAAIKEVIGPDRVLVVDAIQALGAVDFDADAADVLASGGQKWLRAGWGAALLMVRDRVAGLLEPGLGGWSGVIDPIGASHHPRPPRPGAVAHTLTNPDGPAVAALGAALELVRAVGVGPINARIGETLDALLAAARTVGARTAGGGAAGPGERPAGAGSATGSGIGRFRLPGADPQAVHEALTAAGLATTLRTPWIRLSPHASTDRPDAVARLTGALGAVPTG
ncbi:aminotransferase class V-fold PLP-dependent enzyme [Kitasatospora sp. NPDC091207]|uniref:aminotransferase class V-fold PLP-dependent enzyme n=1 Tax=Kitasatospora sp. NPDC091207 TaxID=3364083 RepID=UPI0038116D77